MPNYSNWYWGRSKTLPAMIIKATIPTTQVEDPETALNPTPPASVGPRYGLVPLLVQTTPVQNTNSKDMGTDWFPTIPTRSNPNPPIYSENELLAMGGRLLQIEFALRLCGFIWGKLTLPPDPIESYQLGEGNAVPLLVIKANVPDPPPNQETSSTWHGWIPLFSGETIDLIWNYDNDYLTYLYPQPAGDYTWDEEPREDTIPSQGGLHAIAQRLVALELKLRSMGIIAGDLPPLPLPPDTPIQPLHDPPEWKNDEVYSADPYNFISYKGKSYWSLTDDNENNAPSDSPLAWALLFGE
jgi:hypothetical protein